MQHALNHMFCFWGSGKHCSEGVRECYWSAIVLQKELLVLGDAMGNLTGVMDVFKPHNETMAAAKEVVDKQINSADPGERIVRDVIYVFFFLRVAACAPGCVVKEVVGGNLLPLLPLLPCLSIHTSAVVCAFVLIDQLPPEPVWCSTMV